MLGAEARDERLAALRGGRVAVASGQRDRPVGGADESGAAAGAVDLHVDEVHRRAADEPCDEPVDRGVVEGLRGADLLEHALAHHGDPLAHRHRLDLVVGDVDDGRLESLVEPRDLGAGLDAQLGVEVRERLVHQEDGRLTDDRATEGDALALAAGQLLGLAIEQLLQLDGLRRLVDAAVDLGLRDLAQLETEREILADGHVRIERVALEDHRDVAILRRDVVDDPIADPQHAGGDLLEPCDHPETGRLAAARWSDQDHELAVADLQVQVLHGVEIAVDLVDVLERHGSHASTSTPTDHRGPMHPATEMDSDGPRTWTARRPGIVRPSHAGRNADRARPRVRSIRPPRTRSPWDPLDVDLRIGHRVVWGEPLVLSWATTATFWNSYFWDDPGAKSVYTYDFYNRVGHGNGTATRSQSSDSVDECVPPHVRIQSADGQWYG